MSLTRKTSAIVKRKRAKTNWSAETPPDIGCFREFKFLQANLNLKNSGKIHDVYEMEGKLGSGTFGSVSMAVHKTTKQKRAVKTIFKGFTSKKEEKQLENEMNILQQLSHTNILTLNEYFESDTRLYIVTDVYEGGELFDEIIRRGEFSEQDSSLVVQQLLSCLAYLRSKNIVHRDLKPENILLEKSKDLSAIKLIDFGNAMAYDPNKDKRLTKKIGTPYYMAPEVINHNYDHLCDVWSCGVICYILLSGSPPFGGKDNDEIFQSVLDGKFSFKYDPWPMVSEVAKEFVTKILTYDAKERPEAKELMLHPFILDKKGLSSRRKKVGHKSAVRRLSRNIGLKASTSFDGLKNALMKRHVKKTESRAVKNLRQFTCKLKIATFVQNYVIAQCLPKREKENLAQVFRSWDKNNDGVLSRQELESALKESHPDMLRHIDLLFQLIDVDNDGKIEYQEFLMVTTSKKIMSEDNLTAVFNFLDKDGSGFLEVEELRDALKSVENLDETVAEILGEADTDGDGRISREEFFSVLRVQ